MLSLKYITIMFQWEYCPLHMFLGGSQEECCPVHMLLLSFQGECCPLHMLL